MKNPSKNPIIFLPGLMGSIGGPMILGLKGWSFGIAKWIYDPLMEGLGEIGYRKNENLYICYFDWRKNIEEIVEEYLLPMIEEVRSKYPKGPIDLLCHSMGGIVARQYIQGKYYQGDIERLIMMGTPNKGSLDAYYLWTTGQLVPSKRKTFQKILYRGYIWLLTKILDIPMGIESINEFHENFQGLLDLIPTIDYGDFLWVEDGPEEWVKIPRRYMKYKNSRLDHLNMEIQVLKNRVEEIQCFVGTGYETNKDLILDREALLIHHEEVIKDIITTLEGDNTVILESASIEGVENIVIKSSHRGIVKECIGSIAQIYGVTLEVDYREKVEESDDTIHIILKGDAELSLDLDEKNILTYSNNKVDTEYEYLVERFAGDSAWLCLKNIPKGNYSLKLNSGRKNGIKLLVMSSDVDKEYSSEVASSGTLEIINFRIEE